MTHYGPVDESSYSEQQMCGNVSILHTVRRNCIYPPSTSGYDGREAMDKILVHNRILYYWDNVTIVLP